jgi:hypothetical protein
MITNNNIIEENDNDINRLSSIGLDLECQIEIKEENLIQQNEKIQLKGILKNKDGNNFDNEIIQDILMKILFIIGIIIICVPITFCDLYFGFTDNSCSKKEPPGLSINLKLYLLVSGFIELLILIGSLFIICSSKQLNKISNKNICIVFCGSLIILLVSLFQIIWNILGSFVFWGYIYENGDCNKEFSTYIFVSLLIKLIINLLTLKNFKKNKE